MERTYHRAQIAAQVRSAREALMRAQEGLWALQDYRTAAELLDVDVELEELAESLVGLPRRRPRGCHVS